jgi:hypothetical protein
MIEGTKVYSPPFAVVPLRMILLSCLCMLHLRWGMGSMAGHGEEVGQDMYVDGRSGVTCTGPWMVAISDSADFFFSTTGHIKPQLRHDEIV